MRVVDRLLTDSCPLVAGEKERFVLADRSAAARSELVSTQLWLAIRKRIAGVQCVVTKKLPRGTVESIGARFRDGQNLDGISAVLGAEVGSFNIELCNGIHVRDGNPCFIHPGIGVQ